ncbi:MAG: hypothetical protein H0W70_08070 [Actinobacteria bacterium]|nr:hypothetical protein [Actinomycetota bacterium]
MASEELHTLLAVQDHDTALDQLHHRHETLPERAERQRLLRDGQAIAAERDQIAAQRDEIAEREAALEAELATSEARATQIDKRMYSGEVSASRDLQAMAEEIGRLKSFGSHLEDQALELLDQREPLDARIAELEARLTAMADEIRRLEQAIAIAEEEIDTEVGREQIARDGLAENIPDALLQRYDALRKKLGGTGAAPLNRSSCGGCHLTLPATEIDRIKHSPPDTLILCDQCGRILVPPG